MKRLPLRVSSGLVILALIIATLQILFDVPVAPFLVPSGAGSSAGTELTAKYDDGVQRVSAALNTVLYPSLIVQRGVPVEFTLSAVPENIDECNEWILIPEYGIEQRLVAGDNILRFTPEESGVFQIVCGMGRMKSTVTVVESLGFNVHIGDSTSLFPSSASPAETTEPKTTATPAETTEPKTTATPAETTEPKTTAAPAETTEPKTMAAPVETTEHKTTAAPAETTELKTTTAPAEASTTEPNSSVPPAFEKEDKEISLGGWLENELTPDAGAVGVKEIRTWTGWIFDRCCVGINPVKHTKACNLMGGCYNSGIGIFEYVPGKAYDTYTAVETFLTFDGASKELAVAFLKALPAEWKNNVTVTVTGYAVNNIPAAADELLIPETNLSRVDHYLNGIHITSIEAAYIDGLSTNPLPEPNIVFTQP